MNRHGLSRNIGSDVKRIVRRNSKFSCVVCRAPFCTYEHFDPEFKDATIHDPDGICLLCGSCQTDSTAGRLSKAVIKEKYEERKLESEVESRRENFLFFNRMPKVLLGKSTINHADTIICSDKIDCLSFSRDRETGTFLLNMSIFDSGGHQMLEIKDNTWFSDYAPWDFEFAGKQITFRSAKGVIVFRATFDAENNRVEVSHLDMKLERSRISIDSGDIVVRRTSRDGFRYVTIRTRFGEMNCRAVVFLDNREDVPKFASRVPIMNRSFAGITIGRGANCYIEKFDIQPFGILPMSTPKAETRGRIREAFVEGQLVTVHVKFPFWVEQEHYLNGVKLNGPAISVDDVCEDEFGGLVELYHVGPEDAFQFDISNGLVANRQEDLEKPPIRPHTFA